MSEDIAATVATRSPELINQLFDLIVQPANLMPLILAFGLGWLYSLSPHITRMKRLSDKKFHVYSCNLFVSVSAFIAINYDAEAKLLMSSLMFVAGSSVLLPAVYFKWFKKD